LRSGIQGDSFSLLKQLLCKHRHAWEVPVLLLLALLTNSFAEFLSQTAAAFEVGPVGRSFITYTVAAMSDETGMLFLARPVAERGSPVSAWPCNPTCFQLYSIGDQVMCMICISGLAVMRNSLVWFTDVSVSMRACR
jgi:hypothetical protein